MTRANRGENRSDQTTITTYGATRTPSSKIMQLLSNSASAVHVPMFANALVLVHAVILAQPDAP